MRLGARAPRLDRHLEIALVDLVRLLSKRDTAWRHLDPEAGQLIGQVLAGGRPIRELAWEDELVVGGCSAWRHPRVTTLRPACRGEQVARRGRMMRMPAAWNACSVAGGKPWVA